MKRKALVITFDSVLRNSASNGLPEPYSNLAIRRVELDTGSIRTIRSHELSSLRFLSRRTRFVSRPLTERSVDLGLPTPLQRSRCRTKRPRYHPSPLDCVIWLFSTQRLPNDVHDDRFNAPNGTKFNPVHVLRRPHAKRIRSRGSSCHNALSGASTIGHIVTH